jgi:ribosomal protein S27E
MSLYCPDCGGKVAPQAVPLNMEIVDCPGCHREVARPRRGRRAVRTYQPLTPDEIQRAHITVLLGIFIIVLALVLLRPPFLVSMATAAWDQIPDWIRSRFSGAWPERVIITLLVIACWSCGRKLWRNTQR